MKKLIKASQNILCSYDINTVKTLLKPLKQDGFLVHLNNRGLILGTPERDMYWGAYTDDIINYLNENYDDDFDIDDIDIWDALDAVSESSGAESYWGVESMNEDLREMKSKYLGETSKPKSSIYPKVIEVVDTIYALIDELAPNYDISDYNYYRAGSASKEIDNGGVVIKPNKDEVLLKGHYGLCVWLAGDGAYASDGSRKLAKVLKQNQQWLRDESGLPSLEVIRGGNIMFRLSDIS